MRILTVDLDKGVVDSGELNPDFLNKFIGGFGINLRLAYDLLPKGVDSLSSKNVIIIGNGPLAGTLAPGGSKLLVTTKFPMTGSVATAVGGMNFAGQMKWAGYDHLVITGKAKMPVYLKILDAQVEICDASFLWGKDTYETTDILKQRHGSDFSVLATGQAGEKLAKISLTILDKVSSVGKGGLGAVFGSKNLKAVMVKGTSGVKVASPKQFSRALDGVMDKVKNFTPRMSWVELGAMRKWEYRAKAFFTGNWRYPVPLERATELFGPQIYLDKAKKGRLSCLSCPIAEKEILEVREGPFRGTRTYAGNFPGRVWNWGIRCGAEGYDQVIKLQDLANRSGICAHSSSALIDFLLDLYERGIVTQNETDGLKLERGFATTEALLYKIRNREGIGEALADGFQGVIKRFGSHIETEAQHIKFMDFQKDPRYSALDSTEFAQVVNPRGGRHQSGGSFSAVRQPIKEMRKYAERIGIPQDAFDRIFDPLLGFNVGRMTPHCEDWYSVLNSLGICTESQLNQFYSINECAELFTAATGIPLGAKDLKQAGERIWNLFKMLNVREGFSRKDDKFPSRWLEPYVAPNGKKVYLQNYFQTKRLSENDLEALLDDYYEERGWDKATGIPTTEKLSELGLEFSTEETY